jgi:hypothetical protein
MMLIRDKYVALMGLKQHDKINYYKHYAPLELEN